MRPAGTPVRGTGAVKTSGRSPRTAVGPTSELAGSRPGERLRVAALMALALWCGLLGLARLTAGMAGLSFTEVPVMVASALPCLLVGVAWALVPRRVGWAVAATLAGCTVAAALLWPQIAGAFGSGARGASAESPLGGPLALLVRAQDALPELAGQTALYVVAMPLASMLLACCTLVLGAGWGFALVCVPLLMLCPQVGYEPPLSTVALLATCQVCALGYGAAARRSTRPARAMVSTLAVLALALACAIPAVERNLDDLCRPIERLDALVVRVLDGLSDARGSLGDGATHQDGTDQPAPGAPSAAAYGTAFGGDVSTGELAFSHSEVLEVATTQKPATAVYLRGYVGQDYADGTWSAASESAFVQGQSVLLGIAQDDVAALTAQLPYLMALPYAEAGLLPAATIEVGDPSGAAGPAALTPYGARPEGISGSESRYEAVLVGDYDALLDAGVLGTGAGLATAGEPDATLTALRTAYGSWARSAYLGYPAEEVARLAQVVAENPQPDTASAIRFVERYLAENAVYTTQPEAFPAGVSIPEYFLFEGHEGYCQHFATAAVLMLRLYGVPARYAAGYVAPADAFEQGTDGAWHATLEDTRAHAWAEVYTDELGWVPVETTPAGSTEAAPFSSAHLEGEGQGASDGETEPEAPSREEEAGTQASQEAGHAEDEGRIGGDEAPAQGAGTSPENEDGHGTAEAAGDHSPNDASEGRRGTAGTPPAALVAAGCAVAFLAAVLIAAHLLRARRTARLEARERCTAAELLGDLVDALHYAGLLKGLEGTEDSFARELSGAVPAVSERSAQALCDEAAEAAYGADAAPAGRIARETYRTAAEAALRTLSGPRRLAFKYLHAYL